MVQLDRIVQPTIGEFAAASEVCYSRFPYQRKLDSPERFLGFQKLGVELAVIRGDGGAFQCVCFLLPASLTLDNGEILRWYYMFQVASLPTVPGAGGLLIRQVQQWYPAIFGMGITPDAEKLYKVFKWKPYDGFWRAVHPVDMAHMIEDYGGRIRQPWKRTALQMGSGIYNAASAPIEWLFAAGRMAKSWDGTNWERPLDQSGGGNAGKSAVLGTYLPLFESGGLRAADVGGVGRLFTPLDAGSLADHVALWRALRRRGVKFCEALLYSTEACQAAKRFGYLPMSLQVYCWDKGGILERAIPVLQQRQFTFLDSDKTV